MSLYLVFHFLQLLFTFFLGFLLAQSYAASKGVFKHFSDQKIQLCQFRTLNWLREWFEGSYSVVRTWDAESQGEVCGSAR